MSIGSKKDLEALRRIGFIVALTVQEMFRALRIGMTTAELDEVGRQVLEQHGARSAPKLCYGFAGSTMISINEEVAHAIPGARRIQDGDMVNIDVSAELNGYFADTGSTRPVGNASEVAHRLCEASQEALAQAGGGFGHFQAFANQLGKHDLEILIRSFCVGGGLDAV